MSDVLTRSASLPASSSPAFPEQMTVLRRQQNLSLRGLARCAGISHDALGAWERGERSPRLPELEAVLTALGVKSAERLRLVALVPAPRALSYARAAGAASAGPLPGGGDLLRAMRGRRGLTQAEAARSAGVSQGRLGEWEGSEDWPTAERLHHLCFVLGAHPEETAALTYGGGTLPARDEDAEAGEWISAGHTSPEIPIGRRLYRVYFHADALRDLRSLSLERALWLRALDDDAARFHLHDAYAHRARAMMEEGRYSEVGMYADRTWELARQGYGRSHLWTWSVIASAASLRRGAARRCPRPAAAAALLASLVPQVQPRENRAWMLCEMSLALAEAGQVEEAIRACAEALEMAEQDAVPWEVLFRRRDHAVLLSTLGRHEEALDVLETAADLSHFGSDPVVRHSLLAAACHLGLGRAGAAGDCLAPVLALIERHSPSDLSLARLRPQAEALIARL